jgi:hypothetical protein
LPPGSFAVHRNFAEIGPEVLGVQSMKTKLLLAAVAAGLFAGPALAEDAAPSDNKPVTKPASVCLRYSDVDGWGSRDKRSMIVDDRFGRKYIVSLAGTCSDLDFALGAGFRPLGGHYAGACVDRGDRVVMRGGGVGPVPNTTCWVTKVQTYTKDMAAADKLAKENKQPLADY